MEKIQKDKTLTPKEKMVKIREFMKRKEELKSNIETECSHYEKKCSQFYFSCCNVYDPCKRCHLERETCKTLLLLCPPSLPSEILPSSRLEKSTPKSIKS